MFVVRCLKAVAIVMLLNQHVSVCVIRHWCGQADKTACWITQRGFTSCQWAANSHYSRSSPDWVPLSRSVCWKAATVFSNWVQSRGFTRFRLSVLRWSVTQTHSASHVCQTNASTVRCTFTGRYVMILTMCLISSRSLSSFLSLSPYAVLALCEILGRERLQSKRSRYSRNTRCLVETSAPLLVHLKWNKCNQQDEKTAITGVTVNHFLLQSFTVSGRASYGSQCAVRKPGRLADHFKISYI